MYVKEKENRITDALSRRLHDAYVVAVSTCRSDLKDRILEALCSDGFYHKTKEKLQQSGVQEKYKYYKLNEYGILRLKIQVYIPDLGELRK